MPDVSDWMLVDWIWFLYLPAKSPTRWPDPACPRPERKRKPCQIHLRTQTHQIPGAAENKESHRSDRTYIVLGAELARERSREDNAALAGGGVEVGGARLAARRGET